MAVSGGGRHSLIWRNLGSEKQDQNFKAQKILAATKA